MGENGCLSETTNDGESLATRSQLVDEVFFALQSRDRRYVLYFLLEHESTSLEELVDVVTGWTRTAESGVASQRDRDQVELLLRNRHLPTLLDAAIVDTDEAVVTLAPSGEFVRSFIRRACETEVTAEEVANE